VLFVLTDLNDVIGKNKNFNRLSCKNIFLPLYLTLIENKIQLLKINLNKTN